MSLLGKSAPDFKTKNHLMEDVTLSQFKGKKVVLAFILRLSRAYAKKRCAHSRMASRP